MKHKWKIPFWIGVGSLAWFILRVGPRPARIMYPCQRAALVQMSWAFPAAFISALAGMWSAALNFFRSSRFKRFARVAAVCAAVAAGLLVFFGSRRFWVNSAPVGLKMDRSSARILPFAVPEKGVSLVSFRHDPTAYYGRKPPYDENSNPAYGIVCRAVADLGLGSTSSPLEGFVTSADTVLIKPNLLGDKTGMYTHPSVVRPLIDMCVRAGAKVIWVGDGGPGYVGTEAIMREVGYTDMVEALKSEYPGVRIRTVNLHDLRQWHWVNLGRQSMFCKSGYRDADLADAMGFSLVNSPYYAKKDPQGVNPGGKVMGWYAISDYVLGATVIINAAKMKCHDYMINSLTIKNNVGVTLGSTVSEVEVSTWRIAHLKTRPDFEQVQFETNFGNDIFWRAISDVNRIVLYADSSGVLKVKKQRKYLAFVDAVEASEVNQYGLGMGGGTIYRGQAVFAGTDPVAVDAVASRFMGFDCLKVPVLAKAPLAPPDSGGKYDLGTNDPAGIRITGSIMGPDFSRVFEHSTNWHEYTERERLDIIDFDPPDVSSVGSSPPGPGGRVRITALITGGTAAYLYYEVLGKGYVKKMQRQGAEYTAFIPDIECDYSVQAQDNHFNTRITPFYSRR